MTEPTTPTGRRIYEDVPPVYWDFRDILDIEREAAAVILCDLGWPFDMTHEGWDSPAMRDAVAAEYERREGPCDPDATWRETIDWELEPKR